MKKKLLGVLVLSGVVLLGYNEFATQNASASKEIEESTVQSETMQVSVNDVALTSKIVDRSGFQVKKPQADNGQFIVLNVTTVNNDSYPMLIDAALHYSLVTEDGATFQSVNIHWDDYIQQTLLNPQLQITGDLAFEIPQGLDNFKLQVTSSLTDETLTIPIK